MKAEGVKTEVFMFYSEELRLRVFLAAPESGSGPFPCVQIQHAGGGYESIYEHMAVQLAERGIVGVAMINRGYPGSEGQMEYGKGEITDIGNLSEHLCSRPYIDPERMGIVGYSRGGHNSLLAIEQYDYFIAGALWSTPVDMFELVKVVPWISEMIGGFPDEIPEEYHIRSSINFVEQVNCPLLVLHGESDDVVSVQHALRLAKALDEFSKPYEMRVFPDEWHIWSLSGFENNWRLTLEFFERYLNPMVV